MSLNVYLWLLLHDFSLIFLQLEFKMHGIIRSLPVAGDLELQLPHSYLLSHIYWWSVQLLLSKDSNVVRETYLVDAPSYGRALNLYGEVQKFYDVYFTEIYLHMECLETWWGSHGKRVLEFAKIDVFKMQSEFSEILEFFQIYRVVFSKDIVSMRENFKWINIFKFTKMLHSFRQRLISTPTWALAIKLSHFTGCFISEVLDVVEVEGVLDYLEFAEMIG